MTAAWGWGGVGVNVQERLYSYSVGIIGWLAERPGMLCRPASERHRERRDFQRQMEFTWEQSDLALILNRTAAACIL